MTRIVGYLCLLLAIAFWLPATCCDLNTSSRSLLSENAFDMMVPAPSPSGGGIGRDLLEGNASGVPAPTPRPYGDGDETTMTSFASASSADGLDFLVAAFFLIAAAWLVLALIYSTLVLIVVHLRARGQLDLFDENFGRFYLLGTRCYIPLGCVLRRYVIALTQEEENHGASAPVRLMTREERRMAMELLLVSDEERIQNHHCVSKKENTRTDEEATLSNETCPEEIGRTNQFSAANIEEGHVAEDAFNDEPVCTICLEEYEPSDVCFTSSVCPHRYHHGCIMDWLERRANTECPCCRAPLISDEQVWETVKKQRLERRKQLRKASRGRGLFSWFRPGNDSSEDEETVGPTPPPSPHMSNPDNSVESDTSNQVENDLSVMNENSEDVTIEGRRLFHGN